jgi:rhodanese-related sulfurtransferase
MGKQSAVFALALSIFGCAGIGSHNRIAFKETSQAEVKEMLKSQAPPLIIDVRTPEEFNGELGHIAGARLLPLQILPDSLATISGYKDSTVVLVCRSGRRSAIAAEMLVKAGFKNVHNLTGGMISWNQAK